MKTKLLKTAIVAFALMMSSHLMAFTAVMSGAWSSAATWGGVGPGGNVSNNDIIIPSNLTVNLDMDVTFSGLVNSFTVDGTLSSTNNNVSISSGTFAGTGIVNIHRLSFSGLLTSGTFSGTTTLFSFQNRGASLTLAATINIMDTLDLDSGSVILSAGSNLTMTTGSNIRVNAGTLSSAGGVFNTNSYDVWYVGSSKTTGLEVNSTSLRNLYINMNGNTQTVTQGESNLMVNGNFNMSSGEFAINGNHLTLMGNFMSSAGTQIVSTSTSSLTIQGSGATTNSLMFSGGSSIFDLDINRTSSGNVSLGSALNIAGTLHLHNGHFTLGSGATLTMNSGSNIQVTNGDFVVSGGTFDGSASYNVQYAGGSMNTGLEFTGSGLHNVSVALTSNSSAIQLSINTVVHGELNLMSGMISLHGNSLTLDSSFWQSANAMIIGDSTSDLTLNLQTTSTDTMYFSATGQHIRIFTLNIPSNSEVLLATDLTIHNQLTMTSGSIEITNSNLHMTASAFISGYSDTRYIITSGTGQLQMNVNANSAFVLFPVGTSTHYSPAQIQQTSTGSTGMFSVRAMDGVYTNGLSGYNSAMSSSVVNKTWVIDAANGVNVNMNLKVGWVVADEMNGFNRNQAFISHYMNSNWDSYLAGAAISGANNTYEITRVGITSLSPFAVVDTSALLLIKENPLAAAIYIYPNPSSDFINVETGTVHGSYLYEIFDATGKIVYSVLNSDSVNRINVADFVNGLYFIRITDKSTHASVIKRVVKE